MGKQTSQDEKKAVQDYALEFQKTHDPVIFERILVRVDNLLLYLVNKFCRICPHLLKEDPDSLYNTAIIGLYRGVETIKSTETPDITIARIIAYVQAEFKKQFPYKPVPENFVPELYRRDQREAQWYSEYNSVKAVITQLVKQGAIDEEQALYVAMHFGGGLSFPKIADKLKRQVDVVRDRTNRALKIIRHQFRVRGILTIEEGHGQKKKERSHQNLMGQLKAEFQEQYREKFREEKKSGEVKNGNTRSVGEEAGRKDNLSKASG